MIGRKPLRCLLPLLSAIALTLPHSATGAEETIRYKPVPREVVESRLRKYAGTDPQRIRNGKRRSSRFLPTLDVTSNIFPNRRSRERGSRT
jgi:hypothetical protein